MPLFLSISCVPHRWIVCILCSWALAIISYKNICFDAVAFIVQSYKGKQILPEGGCPFLFTGDSWIRGEPKFQLPEFYWNSKIIEILNNAFYMGQCLAAVPAGVLSDLGYSKCVLSGGMLLVAISYLLFPTSLEFGIFVYVVLNFVEGVGEGSIYPSVISLISRWSPPSERNTFTALVMTGEYYGIGLGQMLFNFIYTSWRFGHYITGIIGFVWVALSLVFISHFPEERTFIFRNELLSITGRHRTRTFFLELKSIPWRKIVISPSFFSLVLVYCSLTWFILANVNVQLISYQRYILHLPAYVIKNSNATTFAILPSLLMGGILADWITKHRPIYKTVIKRTFAFISVFCSSVLVCAAYLVGCNIILFWFLTTSALYTVGLAISTLYSAAVDQSQQHAGLLMGIMFASRTICHILHIQIENYLILDYNNPNHHRNLVLFLNILALVMMIPFLFLGSGETQHRRLPVLTITRSTLHRDIAL